MKKQGRYDTLAELTADSRVYGRALNIFESMGSISSVRDHIAKHMQSNRHETHIVLKRRDLYRVCPTLRARVIRAWRREQAVSSCGGAEGESD
jgi:hypothetical protein